jgi:hypothetical protein
MQQRTAAQPRTKEWTLRLDIAEEGEDVTKADAVLDTGERTMRARSSAQRNPHDPPAPAIGDEYAAGRALLDLGKQLLREATTEAEDNAQIAADDRKV